MSNDKGAKKFAIGTIIAAAVGYIAGLLTAPKSGKETRKDIKDAANKGLSEAERQLKRLHTEMTDLIGQARSKVESLNGKAKSEMEDAIEKARSIKEKARVLLSAVHEGDADDKELKKAIEDANKAVEHLKNYLKKPA